ncbi:MAG TPA: hypothetical protein VEU08_08905, partial [Vicinamibacterales bacterium]|nr:hypothetical protein [Vicinamibacterales bacterium]
MRAASLGVAVRTNGCVGFIPGGSTAGGITGAGITADGSNAVGITAGSLTAGAGAGTPGRAGMTAQTWP